MYNYLKNACCNFGVNLESNKFQWYLDLFDSLSIGYHFIILVSATSLHSASLPLSSEWYIDLVDHHDEMAQNLSVVYLYIFSSTSDPVRKPEEIHFKESHRSPEKWTVLSFIELYRRATLYKKYPY